MSTEILRFPDLAKFGIRSRNTLNRLMAADGFPAAVHISARLIGWDRQAVEAWMASRRSGSSSRLAGNDAQD